MYPLCKHPLTVVFPQYPFLEIVRAGMDAPEESGLQPRHFNNWSSFFYFLAYVVVVAYTLLNLYIGKFHGTAKPRWHVIPQGPVLA